MSKHSEASNWLLETIEALIVAIGEVKTINDLKKSPEMHDLQVAINDYKQSWNN